MHDDKAKITTLAIAKLHEDKIKIKMQTKWYPERVLSMNLL